MPSAGNSQLPGEGSAVVSALPRTSAAYITATVAEVPGVTRAAAVAGGVYADGNLTPRARL